MVLAGFSTELLIWMWTQAQATHLQHADEQLCTQPDLMLECPTVCLRLKHIKNIFHWQGSCKVRNCMETLPSVPCRELQA